MEFPSIGIDLGTTHSCVAVFRDGDVEIIPNEHNEMTTPSWVYITDNEIIVGKRAVLMGPKKPKNTIYDIKRLIGRAFKEVNENDLKAWPFQVIEQDSKPVVKVDNKIYHPEQISAMILAKMKETAEDFLDTKIKDVVITVPAQFNNSQRQATIDAARIAGLNVLQLLVEPTAGALAYGIQHASDQERNVLVYDLGGGTFDVSIVNIKGDKFTVKATDGDTRLGGQDFDNRMVDHFVDEYKSDHKVDLKTDPKAIVRLKMQCEDAKRVLSRHFEAEIEIMNLVGDNDFNSNLSRRKFEELIEPYVVKTKNTIEKVLESAKLKKDQIHDIVLVGGSSRIPSIQAALSYYFNNKPLKKSVNPDEAVAYGAAFQAAILNGDEIVTKVKICDVTPLTLGVDIVFGLMSVLIPRNSPIPISVTDEYFTASDDQEIANVSVYEGEYPFVMNNRNLGTIELYNLPPGPAGSVKFDLTFHLDINGLLKFTAIEKSTGKGKSIDIDYKSDQLPEAQIKLMIEEAERREAKFRTRQLRDRAKANLKTFCDEMMIKVNKNKISGADALIVSNVCNATLEWIETQTTAEFSEEDFEKKLRELEKRFERIKM